MRILVVNDDGINAQGIQALAAKLALKHDVTVVAPDSEKSVTSHSMTLNRPLRVKKVQPHGFDNILCYIVDGTPVDCIKIGIVHIMQGNVDLVVSGINHGSNIGSDMLYSGTVSAAMDAAIAGYKALAVSISSYFPDHLDSASEIALGLIDAGLFDNHTEGLLYNLNVPDLPLSDIRGVMPSVQGKTEYKDVVEVRRDPRNNEYYWISGDIVKNEAVEDTDVSLLRRGYASLTPVKYDLTERKELPRLCEIIKAVNYKKDKGDGF